MMTTDALMALIQTAMDEAGLELREVQEDSVLAVHADGELSLGLDSLRRIAAVFSPEEVAVFVASRITSSLAQLQGRVVPPRLDEVLPRLRPPSEDPDAPWSIPLAQGRLCLSLVADAPDAVRYLGPMDAVALGRPMDALVPLAIQSLIAVAPQGRWSSLQGDVLQSKVNDGNDAARLLALGHWMADERGHLALIPSRDHLWMVGASVPDAPPQILGLREAAISVGGAAAYPISGEIFWAQDGVLTHLPVSGRGDAARFAGLPPALGQ